MQHLATTSEKIVLVNAWGEPIGSAEKLASHHGHTPLHLAFSCYLFNEQGEFLVTQRALTKRVWPGVWTNSCCGHPMPGEDMLKAMKRRLWFELGITAKDINMLLPTYVYKTPPFNGIIEHEFCPVFIARAASDPQPNIEEVAAYQWMPWETYVEKAQLDQNNTYSWWCKDQLTLITHLSLVQQYAGGDKHGRACR